MVPGGHPGQQVVRKAYNWNLVSAGPSRVHLTYEDLLDGPVVTVNRAIDIIDQGIEVDFAAFADPPTRIYEAMGLEKYLMPPLQVWLAAPALMQRGAMYHLQAICSLWEPKLPASVGMRLMPFGALKGVDGKMRHMFCTMAALERISMFRPRRIRVLCADMIGSWDEGKSEEECEKRQQGASEMPFKRWEHERMHLRKFAQKAAGLQIRVEFKSPKKAIIA